MDCILNGVNLPAVNSNNNILFVDNYKEVFFDIYNVEINGKSFIAEFVDNTRTGPLVRIKDFTLGDKVYHNVTFLLVKEKADVRVHLNESNVTQANYSPVPKLIHHVPAKIDKLITEKVQTPVDTSVQKEITKLKEQALLDIEKQKQQLSLIKEQTEYANKIVDSKLEEYKTKLLEHFYHVIEENKDVFVTVAEKKLEDIVAELKQLNSNDIAEKSSTIISEHTQKLTNLFEQEKEKILNVVLEKASTDLTSLINDIDTRLEANFKLSAKELSSDIDKQVKLIKESNQETFNNINDNIKLSVNESENKLIEQYLKIAGDAKQDFEKSATALVNEALANIKISNDKFVSEESNKIFELKSSELHKLINDNKTDLSYEISEKIATYSDELGKKIETKVADVSKTLTEEVKTTFETKYSTFVESTNKIFQYKLTELVKEIDSNKSNLFYHIEEKVLEYTNDLNNIIKEKLSEATTKLVDENKLVFESNYKTLNDKIQEGLNNIESNVDLLQKEKEKFLEKLNEEIQTTLKDLPSTLNNTLNRDNTFVSEVYSKFQQEYGPKIEEVVDKLFKEKNDEVLSEKFDFFKAPKVEQKFIQMVQSEWTKKESELIRKVKKIVLDFYYTWGSGGGSVAVQYAAGGTIDGTLNVTGNILSAGQNLFNILSATGGGGGPTQTPYSVFARSNLTGASAIIDYFDLSAFNSAKYNIQVLSGNDVYSSTVGVLGNSTVGKYTEYAVLYTTTLPFIGYSVNTTGTSLQLIITTTSDLYNMIIKGVRLDPILQ